MHECHRENISYLSSFLMQMAYKKKYYYSMQEIFDRKERFELFLAS